MNLVVLVPSEAYRANAGSRIRYHRLEGPLKEQGVQLSVVDIGTFDVESSDADVLLISKCHDARAHLVAIAANRRGIAVGVDLFDDYFSQPHDARMVRFRRWLAQLVPLLSFALASTPAMAEVLRSYRPDLAVKVVNDPAESHGEGMVVASADRIARKFDDAANEGRLRFAWFGIGDNPHFSVGLHDLHAFSAELAAIRLMTGMTVELSILTNARALTVDRLALIASLPFCTQVGEWSETAEAALLDSSLVCFLPVNAQPFSAAKSLNRAITALASGCQVLSAGYPLYSQLDTLIYRDTRTLASDIKDATLRVSAKRHAELVGQLSKWGCANSEAKGLSSFLSTITGPRNPEAGPAAVMHGAVTSGPAHKLAHKHGDLSLATPYAPSLPGVDAMTLFASPMRFDLFVGKKLAKRTELVQARLAPEDNEVPGFRRAIVGEPALKGVARINLASAPLSVQLALYDSAIERTRELLECELGVTKAILSEMSTIPFPSAVPERSEL